MTAAEQFDAGMQEWFKVLNEPWNRLRYTVAAANLARHLPEGRLRILDVGGGIGGDSFPLAAQGHQVTLVDYAEQMLYAAQQIAAEQGVSAQVTLVQADVNALGQHFKADSFDVVLCHNVLQYVPDMNMALPSLLYPLKRGGVLSVISANRYSESLQAALLRGDLHEALEKLDAHEVAVPLFNTSARRFSADEVMGALQAVGAQVVGHYGLRCVIDYQPDNARKYDSDYYAQLEQLELAMTHRQPYPLFARFFQVVAQKWRM